MSATRDRASAAQPGALGDHAVPVRLWRFDPQTPGGRASRGAGATVEGQGLLALINLPSVREMILGGWQVTSRNGNGSVSAWARDLGATDATAAAVLDACDVSGDVFVVDVDKVEGLGWLVEHRYATIVATLLAARYRPPFNAFGFLGVLGMGWEDHDATPKPLLHALARADVDASRVIEAGNRTAGGRELVPSLRDVAWADCAALAFAGAGSPLAEGMGVDRAMRYVLAGLSDGEIADVEARYAEALNDARGTSVAAIDACVDALVALRC